MERMKTAYTYLDYDPVKDSKRKLRAFPSRKVGRI